MSRVILSVLVLLAAWAWAAPAAAATRRIAVVFGNNTGRLETTPLRYAERDARHFAAVLRQLGHFDQVQLRLGTVVDAAVDTFAGLGEQVGRWKQRGDHVLFLFYYSGHADETGLHLGDSVFDRERLLSRIAGVGAEMTVVVLDACQAGGANRRKGIKTLPPRQVQISGEPQATGRVIIASSAAGEDAQESERLRGSFFSQHLMSGLRGAADRNGNGVVELSEAYDYAYHRTVGSTVTSVAGIQHPSHSVDLRGPRDVSLTFPRRSNSSVRLRSRSSGAFLVMSHDERTVFAEVTARPDQVIEIALGAGRYTVRKRAPNDVLLSDITLAPEQRLVVDESAMSREPYITLAKKGGRVGGWLALNAGLANSLINVGLHPTVELGYAIDFGPVALWPGLSVGFGSEPGEVSDALRVDAISLEPSVAVVALFRLGAYLMGFAGGRVLVPIVFQQVNTDGGRTNLGFGVDATVGVLAWVSRRIGVLLQTYLGTRGAESAKRGQLEDTENVSFRFRLTAGGMAGLCLRF